MPYHISRFFPAYQSYEHGFKKPTSIELLERAYKISGDVGLKFVYLGNLHNTKYENTFCPNCSKLVIKRVTFGIEEFWIDTNGNCQICGFPICKM